MEPVKKVKLDSNFPEISKEDAHETFYEEKRTVAQGISRISGLRKFNNWVKSVLLNEYTQQGFTVLDMCCGKGGDLMKFKANKIAFYVGIDMSKNSIQEAEERFKTIKPGFEGILIVGDVADPEYTIYHRLGDYELEFDLVSCQFALNYLWESEDQVLRVFENMSRWLKPGGVIVSTITDANVLVKKLRVLAKNYTFGNEYYSVKFDREEFPRSQEPFGFKYGFYLEDSVGEAISRAEGLEIKYVPEFLIIKETLEAIASRFDLELVYSRNFHSFYEEYQKKYSKLFNKVMKGNTLDESLWDVAYLYMVVVLRKKGTFEPPPKHSHADSRVEIRYLRHIGID